MKAVTIVSFSLLQQKKYSLRKSCLLHNLTNASSVSYLERCPYLLLNSYDDGPSTHPAGIGRGPPTGTAGSAAELLLASRMQRETPQVIVGYPLSVVARLGMPRAFQSLHRVSASDWLNEVSTASVSLVGYSMLMTGAPVARNFA